MGRQRLKMLPIFGERMYPTIQHTKRVPTNDTVVMRR